MSVSSTSTALQLMWQPFHKLFDNKHKHLSNFKGTENSLECCGIYIEDALSTYDQVHYGQTEESEKWK